MKANEMNAKENSGYVIPTCSILVIPEEPLMAGSGEDKNPPSVNLPSGETSNPNPAKQFTNTTVWDED